MTENPKEGGAKLCVARSAATHSENTHKLDFFQEDSRLRSIREFGYQSLP